MDKRTLMVQGTSSDAGKSLLVAALCRVFTRRGESVLPFKPQNMALNSAVTEDGGEIGRAQAQQAQACGVPPHTDMNPVLLKPSSDIGAQVIIHGRAVAAMQAREYHDYKTTAMAAVLESHQRLLGRAERVIVEGAGSPAEINLRDRDIANMGFAEAVDCPVILVGDIDRGGVFAQFVGTLALLSESEQARVVGFVINKFRGDIKLLESGIEWLEQYTGKPVLGVLPYLHGLALDAEDAIDSQQIDKSDTAIEVQVPALSRISNHTDFDALRHHPQVNLSWIGLGQTPGPADLIILPGSKNVRGDLDWLRRNGWESHIQRHLRYGGKLLGICGGYQMLGMTVADPLGIEDQPGETAGLGLLDLYTQLGPEKRLQQSSGSLCLPGNAPIAGYRIHCGETRGAALSRPLLQLGDGPDGAISEDGQIAGTYLHGLFDQADAAKALLAWAGLDSSQAVDLSALREASLERLADSVEQNLKLELL